MASAIVSYMASTYAPFTLPRNALPANPAPQPLGEAEVPPIGELVALMRSDIICVDRWREHYFSTNHDVFASTWASESFLSSEKLKNRRIPVAGLVVRKTVERLEIRGWGRDTDNDGSANEDNVPEWVDDADSRMDIKTEIANTIHLDAEIAGQGFALIHPSNDMEVGSTVVPVRAGEMIVSYQPGSRWPVWAARYVPRSWVSGSQDPIDRMNLTDRPPDELWVYTKEGVMVYEGKGISNDDWVMTNKGFTYPMALKGYCPIVPFTVESFLNPESGLQPLIGSQEALDQLMVSDAVQIEYAGFPITYSLLDREANTENLMAMLDPKTGRNVLEKSPGAFWQIIADEVGQVPPADPMVVLKRMDFYIKSALTIGSIPQSVWKGTEAEQSGETVQQERESLLSKIDSRVTRYTSSWKRTWEILARARGEEPADVVPQWKPATARDLRNAIELALLMIQAGIRPEDALRNILEDDILDNINMDQVAQPSKEQPMQPAGGGGNNGGGGNTKGQTVATPGNMAPGRRS